MSILHCCTGTNEPTGGANAPASAALAHSDQTKLCRVYTLSEPAWVFSPDSRVL